MIDKSDVDEAFKQAGEGAAARYQSDASPPAILYHYTDAKGLIGIATDRRIHATLIDVLNDTQEIEQALGIIRERLRSRVPDLEFVLSGESALYDSLLDALDARFLHYYVASFCEGGDLLSQWRGYGASGGGYAIGLDGKALASEKGGRFLKKIVYHPAKQAELISEAIDPLLQVYRDQRKRLGHTDTKGIVDLGTIALKELMTSVLPFLPIFKGEGWTEEYEWRLVAPRPSDYRKEIKFRAKPNMIIPYLELDLGDVRILKVVQGPAAESRAARTAAGILMKSQGHDVEIILSTMQIRP